MKNTKDTSFGTPLELLYTMEQRAIDAVDEDASPSALDTSRVLSFTVQKLNFIVNVADVLHITACEKLFPLPQTKKWLRGVTTQKGILYSVTDLSLFAGATTGVNEKKAHLVLLNRPLDQVALLVKQVSGFRHLGDATEVSLKSAHETLLGDLLQFVLSAHRFDEDVFFQLDWDALMKSNRFLEVQ